MAHRISERRPRDGEISFREIDVDDVNLGYRVPMVSVSKISPTSSEIANDCDATRAAVYVFAEERARLSTLGSISIPELPSHHRQRCALPRPADVWGRLACFLQSFARLPVPPAGTTIPSDLRSFIIHAPSSQAEICLAFLRLSLPRASERCVSFCLRIRNDSLARYHRRKIHLPD